MPITAPLINSSSLMKKFSPHLLEQKSASFDAVIFKNSYLNIPETLFYTIEIDLKDFSFENNLIATTIALNFIRLDITKLKDLENKTFEFPINPFEGYIDGSIYLFDVHNPFDVKKIEFKEWKNGSVEAILHYDIDFEYENTGYEKIVDQELHVSLDRGILSIDPEILSTENFSSNKAKQFVSEFVSIEDYEEPEITTGQVIFKMRRD